MTETYELTVPDTGELSVVLTYEYRPEYIEPQSDCGEPGGWEVDAKLRCVTIGKKMMIPMDGIEVLTPAWVKSLTEIATRNITAELEGTA